MERMITEGEEAFLPLRDAIFNTLRREILTGELAPGERLMEIPLADRLGVSRTPVREAIHRLEQEGLVTMIPRKGAQVSCITEKSMTDMLEIRRALDSLCVELACDRIDQNGLQELREACVNFEKAVSSDDPALIAEADVAFHNIIIRATGNERLITLEEGLSQPMYRYRYQYIRDLGGHSNLISEHRRIFESICSGDKGRACAAVKLHVDNQKNAIIRQIRMEENHL